MGPSPTRDDSGSATEAAPRERPTRMLRLSLRTLFLLSAFCTVLAFAVLQFLGNDWRLVARVAQERGRPVQVAFSGDSRRYVTRNADGSVFVGDARTGSRLLQLSPSVEPLYSVVFSPDGRFVAASTLLWGTYVWETEQGKQVGRLTGQQGHVAFSGDSKYLVTTGDDGTSRVWKPPQFDEPVVLSGHTGRVWDAAFSPRSDLLVTTGADGIVCI